LLGLVYEVSLSRLLPLFCPRWWCRVLRRA
jgi:hypothetical protein